MRPSVSTTISISKYYYQKDRPGGRREEERWTKMGKTMRILDGAKKEEDMIWRRKGGGKEEERMRKG